MCRLIEDLVKLERKEALEEGFQKGFRKEFQKGFQKGAQKSAREIALRMLEEGEYTLELISKITRLPLDEVKELQKKQDHEPTT